jgi:hypothetical protein
MRIYKKKDYLIITIFVCIVLICIITINLIKVFEIDCHSGKVRESTRFMGIMLCYKTVETKFSKKCEKFVVNFSPCWHKDYQYSFFSRQYVYYEYHGYIRHTQTIATMDEYYQISSEDQNLLLQYTLKYLDDKYFNHDFFSHLIGYFESDFIKKIDWDTILKDDCNNCLKSSINTCPNILLPSKNDELNSQNHNK